MDMFWKNVRLCLKGEQGMPSLLPNGKDIDAAKEACGEMRQGIRLFCKGLKTFCKMLYKHQEPQRYDTMIGANKLISWQKEGVLPDHLRSAGTIFTTAYSHMHRLGYSPDEVGKVLDNVGSQGRIQQECKTPISGNVDKPLLAINQEDNVEHRDDFERSDHDEGSEGVEDTNVLEESDVEEHDVEDDDNSRFEDDAILSTCTSHESGSDGRFEYSEPSGPATLWGILQTDRCVDEGGNEGIAVEEATSVPCIASPATLWGILESNQSQNQAKNKPVAKDKIAEVGDTIEGQEVLCGPINNPAVGNVGCEGRLVDDVDMSESTTSAAGAGDRAGAGENAQSPGAKANAVISRGISENEGPKSCDIPPIAHACPSEAAIPEEDKHQGEAEGENLQAPALCDITDIMHDTVNEDDQTTFHLASESSSVSLAKDSEVTSGEDDATNLTLSASESSSPRSFSHPQSEKFDFILPKQAQSAGLSKTQKRKLERKRAAVKKAEAAERTRKMQEEAALSPEALAKSLLEDDAKLGEKRRLLQAARMEAWSNTMTLSGA